jgi:bacterial/archaeal transporter family protein
MDMNWLIPTILSILLFGSWGVVVKYAGGKLDTVSFSFFNTLSSLVVIGAVFAYFWFSKSTISITQEGIYISLVAGIIAVLAVLSEATAYKMGSISILAPMIAVGVAVITVAGGLILFKETLTPKIAIGIAMAIVAIYLLSS